MYVNKSPAVAFSDTVKMLERYVRQYIESGELASRWDVFEKEAVDYGKGFDVTTILAATRYTSKQDEHGAYPPNGFNLRFNTVYGGQYAVTLQIDKVRECVGNAEAQARYAAELTESLYQGWIRDKRSAVAAEVNKIFAQSSKSGATVTLGADVDAWALDMFAAIKTAIEDLKEGVSGTSYGNTVVGAGIIAAKNLVVVMSNATSAALDAHGLAKVLTPEYLELRGVSRVSSSSIADNTVLVCDVRNVQVRRKFDYLTDAIPNSDGSYNLFYNKYEFIEAAVDSDSGATAGQVAFPFRVISTTEE